MTKTLLPAALLIMAAAAPTARAESDVVPGKTVGKPGIAMEPRASERRPRVARARSTADAEGPNDPFYTEEWGLPAIDAPGAWERTTGSRDVKVAVVDSGVNFGSPDLAPNLWRNPGESGGGREANGVDDDGNGYVDDWRGWDFIQGDNDPSDGHGHGTHVAGTVAANGNDGVGITGVAWRASIVPVRALDNTKTGDCATLTKGLAYAVRSGARVVNASWGHSWPCQGLRDVIDGAPNTLFVFAAMNQGVDVEQVPTYPCRYPSPNIVCVAATDPSDALADYSNYGAQSVDLAAPGTGVLSAWLKALPAEDVLTDGFETPLAGRWIAGGGPKTWTRTALPDPHGGFWSLSNSDWGDYVDNTDSWARLAEGLDLTGKSVCIAGVWANWALGDWPARPEDARDRLLIETSSDGVDWNRAVYDIPGTSGGYVQLEVDLAPLEGHANGRLRFRLVSDDDGHTYGGVALDDLRIFCVPLATGYTGARDEYDFDDGTSMAAPHVSGVAALMLSLDPTLTAAELKDGLLGSVDKLPALEGKTVSGGRLDAARAVRSVRTDGPPAEPPSAGPSGPTRAAIASALAKDLRAIGRSLASGRIRRGRLPAARPRALVPGRFVLRLERGGALARGSCSRVSAGRCTLTARLTHRGRSLLRNRRRVKATLELAFDPRSGSRLVRRTGVTVR